LGYFSVFIDGVDRGELWAKQVKLFEVDLGSHQLQLKQGGVTRSRLLTFTAASGQIVEFACSRLLTAAGLTGLHEATASEGMRMKSLTVEQPTPRNLAPPDDP
jgi:hypothetical protein